MKKTISVLLLCITLLLVAGCSKKDSLSDSGSGQRQKAPEIVSVTSDTAFYGTSAHLNVVVTDADSVFANGLLMENPAVYITTALTTPTPFTILAKGKGGSVTKTYTVPVWSDSVTNLANNGTWAISWSRVRISEGPWNEGKPTSCEATSVYRFLPGGRGTKTNTCNNQSFGLDWSFLQENSVAKVRIAGDTRTILRLTKDSFVLYTQKPVLNELDKMSETIDIYTH
jgi:hypothetical protein